LNANCAEKSLVRERNPVRRHRPYCRLNLMQSLLTAAVLREATLSLLQVIMGVRNAFIEQRRSLREDVRFPAWIDTGTGGSLIDCTVLDVSDGGARIGVAATARLPHEFYLVLSRSGTRRRCRLVWRSDDEAGLFYLAPLERRDPPPGPLA
jgi:hypothetical protein